MKHLLTLIVLLQVIFVFGQEPATHNKLYLTPELLFGITGEANTGFPETKLQKQLSLNVAWDNSQNAQTWARLLNAPKTGLSLGFTDFGNPDAVGYAVSVLPFMEFGLFKKQTFHIHVGTGFSYFNTQYDPVSNPNNKAISTDFTWSFKLLTYYSVFRTQHINWRLGAGYFHHSNGHIKLPNQGLNSFLVSISAEIGVGKQLDNTVLDDVVIDAESKGTQQYYAWRFGYGKNALSRTFNDANPVYTFSGEYGKIFNSIYKVGIGFYYRFYQNYYNYIVDNESLVQDGREFDHFKEQPFWSASNLGLSINGELLLNHVGIEVQVGFNVYKPAYALDWRINQGWEIVPREIPENSSIELGEYNTYYHIKHLISSRLGLKYYVIGTQKQPKHNLFIGAFINANLGQADFTEIAMGYVHTFKKASL